MVGFGNRGECITHLQTADAKFWPGVLPQHPTLCKLTIDSCLFGRTAQTPFTGFARPGHTMPLSKWLVQGLKQAPQLHHISTLTAKAILDGSSRNLWGHLYTGLRFTTFTNGTDMLVHARQDIQCIEGTVVEGFSKWRDHVFGSRILAPPQDSDEMGLYLTQGSAALLPEVSGCHSNQDLAKEQEDQVPNWKSAWLKGGCVDMTDFNGHALPGWLLDDVYRNVNRPRLWDKGERGVSLPGTVWESLRRWEDTNNMPLRNAW